jgi:hypothetical protein
MIDNFMSSNCLYIDMTYLSSHVASSCRQPKVSAAVKQGIICNIRLATVSIKWLIRMGEGP